ncbi:MAG: NUDIX domain-containing protein [Chryseolinea sp.]
MKYCSKCGKTLTTKAIDHKERICCIDNSCGFIYWNNPIPVVAIVVETANGIVLAHNKLAPRGIFSIITGFLESDETPELASQRETKEELGLDTIETNFLGVFPFQKANQIVIAYHIVAKGQIQLNEELDEIKMVQKSDLLGYSKNNKFEIQEWLDNLNVLA